MSSAVQMRRPAGLTRIIEDLGGALAVRCGEVDCHAVGDVVIHDSAGGGDVALDGAIVLGVGIADSALTAELVGDLGRRGASCLVLRDTGPPWPVSAALVDAVAASGVTLLALVGEVPWLRLGELIRGVLADAALEEGAAAVEHASAGDLFALANQIAAVLDAPVTIEDRQSCVLAFSGGQRDADHSRIATILGRRVPEPYLQALRDRGVFRQIYRERGPVYVEPLSLTDDEAGLPRAVIAVRAGSEVLGSIWAAVSGPLSPDRARALTAASKVVALRLLWLREGADAERRLRTELVRTALAGSTGSAAATRRLGLAGQPVTVLAVTTLEAAGDGAAGSHDAEHLAGLQRIGEALAVHLGAVHSRAAVAVVGDVVYGLLPLNDLAEEGVRAATRVAAGFLDRTGDLDRTVVGVGFPAADVSDLARSRSAAERALRVLTVQQSRTVQQGPTVQHGQTVQQGRTDHHGHSAQGDTRRVASISSVWAEAAILDLRDLLSDRGDLVSGPVSRLVEYDRDHQTQLVATLRAWLDGFGNVIEAAEGLYVHPNTFRYRLRRVAEVGRIDLDSAEDRFAAMLELRLRSWA